MPKCAIKDCDEQVIFPYKACCLDHGFLLKKKRFIEMILSANTREEGLKKWHWHNYDEPTIADVIWYLNL